MCQAPFSTRMPVWVIVGWSEAKTRSSCGGPAGLGPAKSDLSQFTMALPPLSCWRLTCDYMSSQQLLIEAGAFSRGSVASPRAYSLKYLEGDFCELRPETAF